MAGNRLTFHSGYRDKNGKAYNAKHNQRENFEKPKNADRNAYWDYQQRGTETFSESESLFYKQAFGDHVKAHNEKCKKRRQYARMITVEQYREKHPPEEVLLYLGTKNVDVAAFKAVFEDFRDWVKEKCNTPTCGIELLNAALHMDETTPHIHIRQVYWYTNMDGNAEISQNKALEGLGFKRPDETSKSGRFNNAKQTFTAACRAKLFDIAKSHGVELIETPLPKKDVGLSIDEYREREQSRESWKQEQQALCAETKSVRQAIQAEREELRAETEKSEQALAKHEQAIANAYDELIEGFEGLKARRSVINERETALNERYEKLYAEENKALKTQRRASDALGLCEARATRLGDALEKITNGYTELERGWRELGADKKAQETQKALQAVAKEPNEALEEFRRMLASLNEEQCEDEYENNGL